ncbi:hypothetical protein [Tardiphaga robiniae]|uniref:CobQ/CobB/MinD/ParA nucleotide binding domain-containing protein n=1 Tax=Tardiphaga robiniae TaxID=943830 RepID=A0A7G6U6M4_9BRAD|nr:hypothetical protein [Tardiphaga robiniae]QND74656.1 hypothetical protein HB776_28210 [Tardiphaga robiniae]
MRRTPVYIICSTRPMVGKTLVARLLCEFLKLQRGDVTAFDISLKEPSLLDFLPKLTETADVNDTFGKMSLMDRLIVNDDVAKVIDLGYFAFDEFFKMTGEIGFAKEAARRGVAPIVFFMGDSDRASLRGYEMLQQQFTRNSLYVIDNEHVLRGEIPVALAQGRMLRIAALPVFLKTYIDRLNFSFTGYLRSEQDSSTELHQWIRKNYFSFREIELGLLLQGS